MIRNVAVAAVCVLFAVAAFAEDKGQGFIVIADQAVIYKNAETTTETVGTLAKGDALVGFRGFYDSGHNNVWVAAEKNDRLWITFLKPNVKGNPVPTPGWVKKSDVATFRYECGCGPKKGFMDENGDPCNPTRQQGKLANASFSWNPCFEEGRDAKLAALKAAAPAPAAAAAPAQPSAEERLAKLKELLDKGIITKEEYDKKRAEIVNSL